MDTPSLSSVHLSETVIQDEDDAEDAEDTQQSSIDNYTGVSIKVRALSLSLFVF